MTGTFFRMFTKLNLKMLTTTIHYMFVIMTKSLLNVAKLIEDAPLSNFVEERIHRLERQT
jgi:hypothetical protein